LHFKLEFANLYSEKTEVLLRPEGDSIKENDLIALLKILKSFIESVNIAALSNEDLLGEARINQLFLLVDFGNPPPPDITMGNIRDCKNNDELNKFINKRTERTRNITAIYLTSWGELFCKSYAGLNCMPRCISDLSSQLSPEVDDIMRLASKYRSGGMKQLENEEGKVDNRFLKNGIAMIVDGYNAKEIHELMDREMNAMLDRHNSGQKVLRFMSVQAPVFGMAGTLIGLVQMLMHIDDPSTIGPALATALITTFYGLMLANLVLTPIAAKLRMRTDMEGVLGRSIRVGIIGIHDRVNPQKIQRNMNALLPPSQQRE
jgi:flagellar motor component MotA